MRKKLSTDDIATRQKLVEAATILFAENGVAKVTLRELTSYAKVNLAAVNYHFGSKEGLTETVFDVLSARINATRISNLNRILADAKLACTLPSLESIVAAFILPYVQVGPDSSGRLLAHLILMHRLEPTAMSCRIIEKHFDDMASRFIAAFRIACPDVDPVEFYWRYNFMVNTVVLAVTDEAAGNRISRLSGGVADSSDHASLQAALMRYILGGLGASSSTKKAY